MDISHEMLKFVRQNLAEWKPSLGVGSAFQMPLKDQCVDVAFSARLFHHVPDQKERHQYIRELCRVAKKNVILTFFHTWSIKNILRMIRQMVEMVGRMLGLARQGPEEARRTLDETGQTLFGPLFGTLRDAVASPTTTRTRLQGERVVFLSTTP